MGATLCEFVGSGSSYLGDPWAPLIQLGVVVGYSAGHIVFAAAVRMLAIIFAMPSTQA